MTARWQSRRFREPPFPDRTATVKGWARYRELLEDLTAEHGVKATPCDVCGIPMLGDHHARCEP